MKAVTWHGKRDVRVDDGPRPDDRAAHRRDRADHHDRHLRLGPAPLRGRSAPFMDEGDILGHEPMGIVEEVGPSVDATCSVGDRVVIPFQISCGHCFMCDQQPLHPVRDHPGARPGHGRRAVRLLQALRRRCPAARRSSCASRRPSTPTIKVPDGPPDERFVYLSDVLPTAWQSVEYADDPRRRHGRRARARPDRRHGRPDRPAPGRRPGHRRSTWCPSGSSGPARAASRCSTSTRSTTSATPSAT